MNNVQKKLMLGLLVSSLVPTAQTTHAIVLKSRMLELIDGTSFFNGEIIGMTKKIQRDILIMMVGIRTENGYQGKYELEGEFYSVRTLAELEKNCTDPRKKELLDNLLMVVKKEFEDTMAPFIADARSVKEPMIHLITESCERRNRQDSLLLDWSKMGDNDDDETSSFNAQVTSFTIFYKFCGDLAHFLQDLIESCPKARAQFDKMRKQWEDEHKKQ